MGRGRNKLRKEEFHNYNVRKDGEFMEDEIDGNVTEMGVKRK